MRVCEDSISACSQSWSFLLQKKLPLGRGSAPLCLLKDLAQDLGEKASNSHSPRST